MCGICGYWGLNVVPGDGMDLLRRMNSQLSHRGPDAEDYYVGKRAGLAMRRLQVIDLETGDQPITNETDNMHIVFNGEIYNYKELRGRLQAQDHRFKTVSDTEVILHQYESDDEKCVHKFNGMFAFAIWDDVAETLFIARDRIGIKPLYYFWDGKTFLFASEIKALLASGYVPKHVEWQSVWDYMTFRYVPAPRTIWENIYKLPPAHFISLPTFDTLPKPKRYWDIPYSAKPEQGPTQQTNKEFEAIFLDAVHKRLIADVPVGVFLSGGLDSSAITAAISDVSKDKIASFSVAFEGATDIDEREYARNVAYAIGTDHHEVTINQQQFLDFLPELAFWTDEPLADLTTIPLYYLSQKARENVTVVLSGEGSDEILGGYDFETKYQMMHWMRKWQRLPGSIRFLSSFVPRIAGQATLAKKLGLANIPLDTMILRRWGHMTRLMTSESKKQLWNSQSDFPDSLSVANQQFSRCKSTNPLHRMLFMYSQSWLVEDLLMKADKMSMANSLELRTPFLDHRLVEWAARQSPAVKINKNGTGRMVTKWVLREFARNRLPASVLSRPKAGFPIPVYQWLSDKMERWVKDTLLGSSSILENNFKKQAIQEIVRRGTSVKGDIKDKHILWNLLILELWMRRWEPTQ